MIGEKKGVRRRISTPRTSVRYPKKDYFVAGSGVTGAGAGAGAFFFSAAFFSAAAFFLSAAFFSAFVGSAFAAGSAVAAGVAGVTGVAAFSAAITDVQNRKTNAIAHTIKRFIFTTSSFHFFCQSPSDPPTIGDLGNLPRITFITDEGVKPIL
jgi:hypothetical protein